MERGKHEAAKNGPSDTAIPSSRGTCGDMGQCSEYVAYANCGAGNHPMGAIDAV